MRFDLYCRMLWAVDKLESQGRFLTASYVKRWWYKWVSRQ